MDNVASLSFFQRHGLTILARFCIVAFSSFLFQVTTTNIFTDAYLVPVQGKHHHDMVESEGEHLTRCRNFDWMQACDNVEHAAARQLMLPLQYTDSAPNSTKMESYLLDDSDNVSVRYDVNCLRRYRFSVESGITFPYHANQLLHAGGNQYTMALFIQHGAMRDADRYFCSFRKLMLQQTHRPFSQILIIAPDFNYASDEGVLPSDAFWNETKPWGDW